jgi:signal transduction histidine kinase
MSIRSLLLLLVLALWLPAMAGFGLLARFTYLREAAEARQTVQRLAERLNGVVERELDRRQVTVQPAGTGQAPGDAAVQAIVDAEKIAEGLVISVVNDRQRVMARSRDPSTWAGRAATGEVLRRLQDNLPGFLESRTLDGVQAQTYVAARNRHGWSVVLALPEAALTSAARRLTWQAAGASGALLAIGLAMGLYVARRIGAAVVALRGAAQELAQDGVPAPLASGLREVDEISVALHGAGVRSRDATLMLQQKVAEAIDETRTAQAVLLESQKHEAIGRLTGGLAHDFNNLLQTITTGLQVIDRTLGDVPQRRVLQAALRASGKAADLVRQMLAFGRAQPLKPQPIDLHSFLLQRQDLTSKALGPRVKLTASLAPGLPQLLVDPAQLELALLNLVFNSRDAMPEGGRVTIDARLAPPGPNGERMVRLEVADDGPGMDAVTRAKAFDPYFTTKPVGQGSGLGLPQVLAFARQSNGDATLDSAPGRGTRVVLLLPTSDAAPSPEQRVAAAAAGGRLLHVLMVEDDALVASVVAPALESEGHRVTVLGTAEQAQDVLQQRDMAFDVLFTDIVMPGRASGLDLTAWCRTQRPALAIVIATGYSARDIESDLIVLRKPYTIDALLLALQDAVRPRAEGGLAGTAGGRAS